MKTIEKRLEEAQTLVTGDLVQSPSRGCAAAASRDRLLASNANLAVAARLAKWLLRPWAKAQASLLTS